MRVIHVSVMGVFILAVVRNITDVVICMCLCLFRVLMCQLQ